MNAGQYFGLNGDYNGLGYVSKEDIRPELPEGRDYAPEERDNEYFAKKYEQIFCRIVGEIEHGHIQFASSEEEDKECAAACRAWYRYRDRAEMYYAKKYHCEEQTAERYKSKWCRYPDWYKPSA